MFDFKKIDSWIENNQNVLFVGKHGVGKTAIIKESFERNKLNYQYFSASTMDPWVDFIGVPKVMNSIESEDLKLIKDLAKIDQSIAIKWIQNNWLLDLEDSNKILNKLLIRNTIHLDLIRPKQFANGNIEALFFDEFNRAPKKVRNAVMELIQFKSINGLKFPKLKIVWAAINPEDQEYDTEALDPAQKDRFHIFFDVPYLPNVDWFRERYGEKIANSAIQWWNELNDKNEVSPRRLQYALDSYLRGDNLRDILPKSSNVSKLLSSLKNSPIIERLQEFLKRKDHDAAKCFLENENNFFSSINYIKKSKDFREFFLHLVSKEKLSSLISSDNMVFNHIIKNLNKHKVFKELCEEIIEANTNKTLAKKIRRSYTEFLAKNYS